MNTKFFLASKTIIGAILVTLKAFDITLPLDEGKIAEVIDALQVIVGAILIVWGRATADKPLGVIPGFTSKLFK